MTAQGLRPRAAHPLRVLSAIRNALTTDGVCLLLEPPPGSEPDGPSSLQQLTARAGFSRFRALASDGRLQLFELRR